MNIHADMSQGRGKHGTRPSTCTRIISGHEKCFLSVPNPWRLSCEKGFSKIKVIQTVLFLRKKIYDTEVNKRASRRERRGRRGVHKRELPGDQDFL